MVKKKNPKKYKERDWIHFYYVDHMYSLTDIANIADCHPKTIRYWLKKYSIPLRSPAEARSLQAKLISKTNSASKNLNGAVGSFVIDFERLCRDLRSGVRSVLEANGLKKAWEITDILVGDLTAFPLQSILRALIAETCQLDEGEKKILNVLFGRISRLGEERNAIIHSAWYIDYKNPSDILHNSYLRYRTGYSKRGSKPAPTTHNITEIQNMDKECIVLLHLMDDLSDCLSKHHRIRDYLELVGKKEINTKKD